MTYIKKKLVLLLAVIPMIVCAVPSVQAEFLLHANFSSQVDEIFGRESFEKYMNENGVKTIIHVFPTDVCINRLKNGYCNLSISADNPRRDGKDVGLIAIPICKDPLVIITHSGNKVKNLSLSQICDIFSGKTTNWKEVGGNDIPITLVTPSKETDAYKNFMHQVMGPFEINNQLIADKAFNVVTCIKNIPGTVSFIANSIAVQYPDLNVVRINGAGPHDESYPLHQVFCLMIKKESEPKMKNVINYLLSDKANKKMNTLGITPLLR